MRDLHADLITAQQSGATDPYISLVINSTDYSSRVLSIEHIEEPYRESATIILANSDRLFNSTSLIGYPFTIGYGYTYGGVNHYLGDGTNPAMPTLWVKTQSMVSMEGKLICILECEGMWARLDEYHFSILTDPLRYSVDFQTKETVYALIEKCLLAAGMSLTYESLDNIITTLHPTFSADPLNLESASYIIYRLLQMTNCYLRPKASLTFEVVAPSEADAVQETYYSGQAPHFREYTERDKILVPNHIIVLGNRDPISGNWDTEEYPIIIGHYRDPDCFSGTTYTGTYTEIIQYAILPSINRTADAENQAMAILARLKTETLAGRLILPFHDCRVELYDKMLVIDNRGV